jgi:hypothetical protein
MARVVSFMYADNTTNERTANNEGALIVHSPLIVFRPLFVPCLFSFSIVAGIQDFDANKGHNIKLEFWKNGGDAPLVRTEDFQLPPIEEKSDLPSHLKGFVFNIDLRNVPFRENGEYFTEIFFDGESLGKYPINVWRKEES